MVTSARWMMLADNTIGEDEQRAVSAVLGSRWLSAGPETRSFESEFATALGVADAVAVSSGTAALHLTMMALGLEPGDEVVVPSLSFVASAATVALGGATPVFADIRSPRDLTIDPDDVARLLTPRTRAVVAMHYGGYPADFEALGRLTRARGIHLIEDAAHAPVVRAGRQLLGAVGDVGCFSFFATKNLTTGEGGMVVASDRTLLDRVRAMRSHCMTTSTWDRATTGRSGYDVSGIGLNYRPTEIASALGRVQLSKLPEDRRRRRAITEVYRERLASIPGVVVPFTERHDDAAYHLMVILLPEGLDRDTLQVALRAAGIETSVHYPPTHRFSYYRRRFPSASRSLRVTEMLADRLLTLPLHGRMSLDDAAFVAETVEEILRTARGSAR